MIRSFVADITSSLMYKNHIQIHPWYNLYPGGNSLYNLTPMRETIFAEFGVVFMHVMHVLGGEMAQNSFSDGGHQELSNNLGPIEMGQQMAEL